MKALGLLCGMSWESTAVYYQLLNKGARERLGGLVSANLRMHSFEFSEIARLQAEGDWQALTQMMVDAALGLKAAGAEGLMICTNTMHIMASEIESVANLPLIHIADVAGKAMQEARCSKPLLLATRFTMEKPFYKQHLKDHYGIEAIVPGAADIQAVHDIIYSELCQGIIKPKSKLAYIDLVNKLQAEQGIDGLILGCTEIDLLIGQDDFALPVFDTTALHAAAGVDFMMAS